jgi:molybdate transport system permease protein
MALLQTDWQPVFLSLRVACIALVSVTCLGLPLARLLARREFFGKEVLEAAITLPLVLPPSVIGLPAWYCPLHVPWANSGRP